MIISNFQFPISKKTAALFLGFLVLAGSILGVALAVKRIQDQKSTISRPKAAGGCTGSLQFYQDNGGDCRIPSYKKFEADKCNGTGCFWDDLSGGSSCRSDGSTTCWCPSSTFNCATITDKATCESKNNGVSISGEKQTCKWEGGSNSSSGSYSASSPKGGEQVSSLTPTFSWTGNMPSNNTYKNICIGTWVSTSSCESLGCRSVTGQDSYVMPTALSPNTTYGWTIYSAGAGTSNVTNMSGGCQQFKTGEAPPELPLSCTTDVSCSGPSNTGVATNTTIIDGKVGKARDFPGHSIVAIKNYSRINLAGSVTVMAWIKPSSLPTGHNRYIWSRGSNQFGEYRFYQDGSELGFGFTDKGTWKQHKTTNAGLLAGSWQHVAVVLDTTAGKVRIYINGVEKYAGAESAKLAKNTLSFAIGRIADQDEGTFDGGIDEVRLYSRALTAAEITAYNSGLSNNSLVGWWPMDETSGNTVSDASRKCSAGSCVDLPTETDSGEINACWGDESGKSGRCYDCNGDGAINILDFSCFAKRWLEKISP